MAGFLVQEGKTEKMVTSEYVPSFELLLTVLGAEGKEIQEKITVVSFVTIP